MNNIAVLIIRLLYILAWNITAAIEIAVLCVDQTIDGRMVAYILSCVVLHVVAGFIIIYTITWKKEPIGKWELLAYSTIGCSIAAVILYFMLDQTTLSMYEKSYPMTLLALYMEIGLIFYNIATAHIILLWSACVNLAIVGRITSLIASRTQQVDQGIV
jgi:hypothetical protein